MFWKSLLIDFVTKSISVMTPEIRDSVCNTLRDLKKKSDTTDNPIDDAVVNFLINLMDCNAD